MKGIPGIKRAGIIFFLLTFFSFPGAAEDYTIENWYNPTKIEELVESFTMLRYKWATEERVMEFEYQWEGVETVAGQEADKSVITLDSPGEDLRKIIIWLDKAGELVQAEIDGEIIPKVFADMMLKSVLQLVFLPFQMADFYLGEEIIAGHLVDGWTARVVGKESRKVGGGTIDTLSMEGLLGPPAASSEYEVHWVIGDFGDVQMLLTWQANEIGSSDYVYYELKEVVLK